MRIITGKLKGRRISLPAKLDVRPTTDRTKESMFGIIEARKVLDGASVLDLFGGSGNLGFEAISRGAGHVVFVEKNPDAVSHINKIAEIFDVEQQVTVVNTPVEKFLQTSRPQYDLIFADPPYDLLFVENMVREITENNWLSEDGWFILEHDKRFDFTGHSHCAFSKAYGRTIVSIFYPNPVLKEE